MASRRRQTLQLDPVCRKKGKVSSKVRMSSHPANPLLGMMSSYHSDEDEEEEEEGKTELKDDPQIEEDEEESREEKKEPVKKRTQIDEQVADFLKMISTMEDDDPGPATPPHTSVSTVAPTTTDEADKDGLEGRIHGVTDSDDATDNNSSVVWQPCIDSNSGYTYYWNTKTNEVSWTLPEDIVPSDADNKLSDTLTTTTTTTTTETTRLPVPTGSGTGDLNEVCTEDSNDDLNTVTNVDESSNRHGELPDDTEMAEDDTSDGQSVHTDDDTEPQATSNDHVIASIRPTSPSEETSMDTSNPSATEKSGIVDDVTEQTIEGGEVESETLCVNYQSNRSDQQEDDEGTFPEQSNDHFPPPTNSSGIVVYAESSEEESDVDDLLDRALIENTDETSHLQERKPRLRKRISYKVDPVKPATKKLKVTSEISTGESSDIVQKEDDSEEEQSLETEGNVEHSVAGSDVEKGRVEAACVELLKRLSLLGVSREGLHDLVVEMVKLETRILDWQKGFLPNDYILTCLSNTVHLLANYEAQIPPPGWTYVWDSDFQQYYFFNAETKKSSWDYPVVDGREGKGESPDVTPTPEETTSVLRGVESSSMRTTTPPPGVDVNVDLPIVCEEWQAPPPPPPPLEEGEVPPSPPSLPTVSDENSENEEEEEEEAKPFVVAAQPQIYYGPTMPPPEEEVETPSESKESSPSIEENRKKPKKKVLKVKMQGKKGKAVTSLLQKWTAMHHS